MNPEILIAVVQARAAQLDGVTSGGRPEWTVLECAWGLSRLPAGPLNAFLWRYARDGKALATLLPALLNEAVRLARRERWPERVDGLPYLTELTAVVVHEEHMSDVQRDRLLRRLEATWGPEIWSRHLARKHRAIGVLLDRWVTDGYEHVARRIREDEA